MMNYDMMRGADSGGMQFFAWIVYLLVVVVLVLSVAALWKYVNKK